MYKMVEVEIVVGKRGVEHGLSVAASEETETLEIDGGTNVVARQRVELLRGWWVEISLCCCCFLLLVALPG
jgi:hypothetical protein